MRGRGRFAVVGGALLLAACGYVLPAKYRYRMTVEVRTPQGVRTGSAVYEVEAYQRVRITSEDAAGGSSLRGQAVVVDLPSGPLFVMMEKPDASDLLQGEVTHALLPDVEIRGDPSRYVGAVRKLGNVWWSRKAELPRADWPLVVRFKNLNDPTSIEAVDPVAAGVSRISVATTWDAISIGIEKVFPGWFRRLRKAHATLSGNSSSIVSSNRLDANLSPGSFSTELGNE